MAVSRCCAGMTGQLELSPVFVRGCILKYSPRDSSQQKLV